MKLSEDQLGRLKIDLRQEILACNTSKKDLVLWWAEVRKMKLGRAQDQSVQIIKGMPGYFFPLYRPKRNGVIDTTYSAFCSIDPVVQMIDPTQGGFNLVFAEKAVGNLAKRAKWELQFKDALGWALDVNLGTMRVRPIHGDDGEVSGVDIESIDPMRMIGWPSGFKDYDKLKTVGHCYYDLVIRIREKIQNGTFDLVDDPDMVVGGANPDDTNLSQTQVNGGKNRATGNDSNLSPMDRWVQVYELVTEFQMDKDSYERVKLSVTYDFTDDQILAVDPFGALDEDGELDVPYPCWYVPFRATWDSDEGLWPEDSIGRPIIGLQQAYNKNMNTIQQGGMFAAFGVHVITGGATKTKVIKMTPGMVYEGPSSMKVESFSFPFNPQNIEFVNDKIENIVDTLMGRTQLGTGANVAASTSATAVNALQQAQTEAKDGYIDTVAPSVAEVYELIWFFLTTHYATLKKAMPRDIDIPNYEEIKKLNPEFEVTGQSSASNPQGLAGKLMSIITMLGTPVQMPLGSQFDINKIHEKIIDALDLPFSTKQIMHTILQDQKGELADIVKQLLEEGNSPADIRQGMNIFLQTQQEAAAQAAQQQNASPPPSQGQPAQVPPSPPQPVPAPQQSGAGTPQAPGMDSSEAPPANAA